MRLEGVEVAMVCAPCFRQQHHRCAGAVTYRFAQGGEVTQGCECGANHYGRVRRS